MIGYLRQAISSFRRTEVLVFLPALTLAAFWIGGEGALLMIALGLPLVTLVVVLVGQGAGGGPTGGTRMIEDLDTVMALQAEAGRTTACFVLQFDDPVGLIDRYGRTTQSEILACCNDRVRGAMRLGDSLTALEDGSLVVVLAPVYRLDLETMVQIAGRIQAVVHQPIMARADVVHVTCSIGFCHGRRAPEPTGRSLLDAAQIAADEARRHGPGAIRAFSIDMARAKVNRDALRDGVEIALADGQIKAHFQPQISTDTGAISGMEALARWYHPDRGCLLPGEFLPVIEGTGLSERLNQVMVAEALSALADWDRAGFSVPTVSVNFSAAELNDPKLPERLKWELDRFDLTTDRLTIEVLETVVASSENDMIAVNIATLAAMGCGIDLDDFGTGNASITSIRRFALRRLKIDRSFVTGVDEDREQQKLVAAILSMAERLGLETMAEGVESPAEHTMLAQLGCRHVQGYGIARPMPADEVTVWMGRHIERIATTPRIGQKAR
ncbi:bifunctional diguanylate cyclase/phosphodiesterase [Tabrizicola sp.]|uniref:putative bifunctional diguanylate cyclase/phosphodiesterase n=1 Tax=Tabrizicola sp. TaxID=2005166 RepID=UPI00286A7A63|nr:bifunctional diguanylate cyclase/phosphodiesterase [Tabrizicola sp.]